MTKQKLIGIFCLTIALLAIFAQVFYYSFLIPKGYEYIWDMFPYFVNTLIIICIGLSIYTMTNHFKTMYTIIATGIFIFINSGYMLMSESLRNSIVSFHNIQSPMVIKFDPETKLATAYQKTYFLFAKNPQVLDSPVDQYEIKWLTNNIAAFIYQSNDKQHLYVNANGDYGRGSYYHAASELQGTWENNKQTITIQSTNMLIDETTYDLSNATEAGTVAVILHDGQGNADFIIGYGDDLRFTSQGYIKKGSSIVLLDLRDPTYQSTTYSKTSTDFSETANMATPIEQGKQYINEMKGLIQKDPTLANFTNDYYVVKVDDISSDPKDIAIKVLQTFEGQSGQGSNCSSDVTLKSVTVTAGSPQDFFMEVFTTETASCSIESETLDITWFYRVMKADNAYLVRKTLQFEKGDHGLKTIDNPENLPCIGDQYHYFLQK